MERTRILRSSALLAVAALLIAAVTYGPAIVGDYGRLDDYGYVAGSKQGTLEGLWSFYLDSGRPLPAFLMTVLAPQISTVEALVWFRIACTATMALGATAAAVMALRVLGPTRGPIPLILAAAVAAVALSTPSTPSTVTWAILTGSAPAYAAALAAGILATTSLRWWWVPASVLVVAAAFSYQHVTPVAVLPPLLWSAARWARREPAQWPRPFIVAAVSIVALAADYVMVTVRDGVGTDRMTPVTTSERLRWFAEEFVPRTLDLTVPGTSTTLTWSLALLAVLLLTPLLAGPRYLACSAAVLVAWAGTSMVVIPVELWASNRLASGAQLVIWAGAATCAAIGVANARAQMVRIGGTVAGVAVAAWSLVVAGQRATDYLAAPNEVDWAAIQCVAAQEDVVPGTQIAPNPWWGSTSAVIDMDEYGVVASSTPWAIVEAMYLAESATRDGADPGFVPADLEVLPLDAGVEGSVSVPQDACAAGG